MVLLCLARPHPKLAALPRWATAGGRGLLQALLLELRADVEVVLRREADRSG